MRFPSLGRLARRTALVAAAATGVAVLTPVTPVVDSPTATASSVIPTDSSLGPVGSSLPTSEKLDPAHAAYDALPSVIKDLPQVKAEARKNGWLTPPAPAPGKGAPGAASARPAAQSAPSPAPNPTCSNCVALTFDDGPAESTETVLNVLAANRVHASFFVLAPHARQYPQQLQRMRREGHTIGNHTNTHRELSKLAPGDIAGEISVGTRAITDAAGGTVRWMRPPYGATNANVAAAAAAAGQAQALWSVDTLDWKHRDPQRTCQAVAQEAQPGSIVLMHDIHATTAQATQCVIDAVRAKGLLPVSLDEMIGQPVPGRQYLTR